MRKNVSVALALVMALSLILCGVAAEAKDSEIAVVVKISGIPWFNRLEEGVKRAAGELKVNAYQQGPSDADPAQQVKIVEDLIAKGRDIEGLTLARAVGYHIERRVFLNANRTVVL